MERFFEWIGRILYKIVDLWRSFFTNKYAVTGLLACFVLIFILSLVIAVWLDIHTLYWVPLSFGVCLTLLFAYWAITWV